MIKIRPANEQDAEILANIQKEAFLPLYIKYRDKDNPCLRGAEDILRRLNTPRFKYFCILDDDVIIGGAFLRCTGSGIFFENLGESEYYLQRIFIKPDCQNKGIAQTAILLCEKEFPDAKLFWVDFPEDMEKNRRCYEKAGFRDTGKRKEVENRLVLACFEKAIIHKEPPDIRLITPDDLPDALSVIHRSFATVAPNSV
jgi:ribosomal protein S18 acetylase RimI-like enzyme